MLDRRDWNIKLGRLMKGNKQSGLWERLWERTKEVAVTYTGTFIVVMILNQLLFFGFCLNPICLVAAMPHVLLITVIVGSIINKIGNWGERGLVKKGANIASNKLEQFGDAIETASEEFKEERRIASLPEMVVIPSGSFLMGSSEDDEVRYDSEGPQHLVTIDYKFAVGKYTVTFTEFDYFLSQSGYKHRPNDEGWGRGTQPVINVSWDDAQAYCRWLSKEMSAFGGKADIAQRLLRHSQGMINSPRHIPLRPTLAFCSSRT